MVFAGLITLLLASSSAALEAQVLLIVSVQVDATPTREEPFTQSPCPEGAGCRSANAVETETPTWSPSSAPTDIAVAPGGPSPLLERHWYGYQLMLSDLASILVAGVGVMVGYGTTGCEPQSNCDTSRSAALFLIGAGAVGFAIAPPLIHLIHGQPGSAAGSFFLRAVIPILSGLALQNWSGVALVVAIEMLAAMMIDDVLLSSERAQSKEVRVEPSSSMAAPGQGAMTLAYGGHF